MRAPIIYVISPMTQGSPDDIYPEVARVANELIDLGYVVICPQWNIFLAVARPRTVEEWYTYSLRMVGVADALYRVQPRAISVGGTLEQFEGGRRGLPLFSKLSDAALWLKHRNAPSS